MTQKLELHRSDDEVFLERDGEKLGRLEFRREEDTVVFEHMEVDESLRGEGRARELLDFAIDWIREEGLKARSECPYVQRQFDRDDSFDDILAD